MGRRRLSLERLYARGPRRYVVACVAIIWTIALGMTTLISLVFGALYLRMGVDQLVTVTLLADAGTLAGVIVAAAVVARTTARPLLRWVAGIRDEDGARAAWESGTRATFRWPALAGLLCALFTIPAGLYIFSVSGVPVAIMIFVVAPVVQVGIVAAVIVCYFVVESFMRPVITEINGSLPNEFEPRAWSPSLRGRLVPTVLAVEMFASLLAGGLVSHASGVAETLLYSLLAGIVVTLTFSLAWTFALSRSILGPVGDLVAATGSVRQGDLTQSVPLVGNDELTQLGRSFNEMLDGLREREHLRDENVLQAEELRASRARIVAASDAERRRVERNIHDGAQQQMVALALLRWRLSCGCSRHGRDRAAAEIKSGTFRSR